MTYQLLSLRGFPFILFPAFESIRKQKMVLIILLLLHIVQAYQRDHRTLPIQSEPLPTFSEIGLTNHTVRVGNEVSFACTVENLGNYKVAWLHAEKGTLAVHPMVITQNERLSVSTDSRNTYYLSIKEIRESDAGKYICQINTGPPQISISGHINVVVPPEILDDSSSSDTLATEGMRVTLTCNAIGNPIPNISWRRNDRSKIRVCPGTEPFGASSDSFNVNGGKLFPKPGCREEEEYHGSNLVLNQLSRSDSGVYLCIARNGVQPSVSKRVMLYVDFPPTLWITHQQVHADIGSTVKLDCLTAAHPPSINYWSRDGKNYITPIKGKYQMEEEKGRPQFYNKLMKLHIHNITREDFGKYKCLAKNSQGETSGEIELNEVVKPSTTASPYVELKYEWPNHKVKEVEIVTNVVCKGEECTNGADFGSFQGKSQKNRKRRRKNRRRNGKNRKIGPTGTDIDEYGPRNNFNDYNGDDSSSSFHRDTSDKFQLNSAESVLPLLSFYLFPIMIFQWKSCYHFG